MSNTVSLAARLKGLLGADRIDETNSKLQDYAIDGLLPRVVVRPVSAEEVVEVMRFAASESLAVVPCGSRSKLELGMPPERYDIAAEMTGLDSVAYYDAEDLTLSVNAGASLRTMTEFLAAKNQFLPLGVPCFESSTVGGAVCSGIDSALRQQYGTARDFLIGAEFVDGKGQLCKSGGRVVKNVTGYDLHKLLIGSLGTLGILTTLNFRTFPLPEDSGGHIAGFASAEDAFLYRSTVESSGLPFANLELLGPEIISILLAIAKRADADLPPALDKSKWCVYAAFEGREAVLKRIVNDLEKLAGGNSSHQHCAIEKAPDETLGGLLREAFEWLRFAAPQVALMRITIPKLVPKDLAEFANAAMQAGHKHAVLLRAAGVIYFAVFAESEESADVESLTGTVTKIAAAVEGRQGIARLLHAPAEVKRAYAGQRIAKLDLNMEQRIKQAFDPQNILAPGRIVGGI